MALRILTLFGEEIVPEAATAPTKTRAAKKPKPAVAEEDDEAPAVARPKSKVTATETAPKEKNVTAKRPAAEILKDWVAEKQYYTIGEVAVLFLVKTSHIRFWTNEFELKVRTTRKGDRLYTPAQIKELQVIYHLVKERGFTISGAKAKLKSNKKMADEGVDLKQSLTQLRGKLLQIRNQIT